MTTDLCARMDIFANGAFFTCALAADAASWRPVDGLLGATKKTCYPAHQISINLLKRCKLKFRSVFAIMLRVCAVSADSPARAR